MTSILAIDTAADICSVALLHANQTFYRHSDAARRHAVDVLPMVESLLAESETELHTLDAVAMISGPGSFTGLRIGAAVVQGLAYGASLPVISISALMVLARSAFLAHQSPQDEQKCIYVCQHAREDEFYFGIYHDSGDGLPKALLKDQVCDASTIKNHISRASDTGAILAGKGWRHEQLDIPASLRQSDAECNAILLAEMAISAFAAGTVLPPAEALPAYLKEDLAYRKS